MTQQAQPVAASDAFRLYDTATQSVRLFEPVVPGRVSIYHCGLTVQSGPHLGHIRKEVVFDVLRRWLTWCGYEVTVIANITDIDDKILIKSAEAGTPWFALAYRFERELHDAYAALGCLPPTYEPRATGHIPEMIEMIKVLIERGHVTDDLHDPYPFRASRHDRARFTPSPGQVQEPSPLGSYGAGSNPPDGSRGPATPCQRGRWSSRTSLILRFSL